MAKALGIIVIIFIFGFLAFLIYQDDSGNIDLEETVGVDVSKLQEVTKSIKCYTDTKSFECGSLTFDYNNESIKSDTKIIKVTEEQLVIADDGTESIQNVTTTKEVPAVSEADISFLDKQSGEFMVCHQGNQCVISAQVKLYNQNEEYVDPPYGYQLVITCEFREFCDTSRTRTTNAGETTDGGGGIKYSWTTTHQDQLGDYEIRISIRSAIPDVNGNPINLVQTIPMVLIS